MKYNLYLERLDSRGHDATSTLSLRVEREAPPVTLSDFVGGHASLYDGYGAVDQSFVVLAHTGKPGVILANTEGAGEVRLESFVSPLAVSQLLRLEKDECAYRITHSNWWPARRTS